MKSDKTNRNPSDRPLIKSRLMELIAGSSARLTVCDIERCLLQDEAIYQGQSKRAIQEAVRAAVKELTTEGLLAFHTDLGNSFLELAINRAVRISPKTILKPPSISYTPQPDETVIDILSGASFGNGQHPTTRLSLQAIEYVLKDARLLETNPHACALDIGTGSGVLAIAAVLSGVSEAVGIDTDPCARYEAAQNVRLNRLESRIRISSEPAETLSGRFDLILANLRFPTLIYLHPKIRQWIGKSGIVILSGMKIEESPEIRQMYQRDGFQPIHSLNKHLWACEVFCFNPSLIYRATV